MSNLNILTLIIFLSSALCASNTNKDDILYSDLFRKRFVSILRDTDDFESFEINLREKLFDLFDRDELSFGDLDESFQCKENISKLLFELFNHQLPPLTNDGHAVPVEEIKKNFKKQMRRYGNISKIFKNGMDMIKNSFFQPELTDHCHMMPIIQELEVKSAETLEKFYKQEPISNESNDIEPFMGFFKKEIDCVKHLVYNLKGNGELSISQLKRMADGHVCKMLLLLNTKNIANLIFNFDRIIKNESNFKVITFRHDDLELKYETEIFVLYMDLLASLETMYLFFNKELFN